MSALQRLAGAIPRGRKARDRRPPRPPRSPRCRLQVEPLENRVLMSLGLLGQWNGSSNYSDGWIVGDYAFLGHYGLSQGIHIIDISDPTNPVETARFTSPGTTNDFRDIEVQWQMVGKERRLIGYISGDGAANGVVVADFTDPFNPQQLYRIRANPDGGTDFVHTLSVDGRYLYEADSRSRTIRVFDVSNPSQPVKVRDIISFTSPEAVHEVTVQNGRLYTAGISGGTAEIWDVSQIGEKGNPVTYLGRRVGSISAAHTTWPTDDNRFMAVARETAAGDLSFWNIENPANPQLAWRMDLREPGGCCVHQVLIRGKMLYSSWYTAGIYVHDITDPYNPVELGHYDTFPGGGGGFNGAWGVFGSRDNKIVAAFDMRSGLFLFQHVQDPRDTPPGGFQGSGSRAVRGAWAEGRDISEFAPEQIARLDDSTLTLTLGAGDDTVAVARGAGGQTLDVVINDSIRFSYAAGQVRRLNIRALEGDDRIVLDPSLRLELMVDGGPGQDTIEGWSEAWVNPPIAHKSNMQGMRADPYTTLAVEDVRTVPPPQGPLDYSAHALVEHAGIAMVPAGMGTLLRMGHTGVLMDAAVVPSHRLMPLGHGGARLAATDHLYGGLPKQVVWHKPG